MQEQSTKTRKILITTHSDLLLSAINNLIIFYSNKDKASRLGLSPSDLIDPESIAAYATRIKNSYVELEKLQVDEAGIPEDEFAEIVHEMAVERSHAFF